MIGYFRSAWICGAVTSATLCWSTVDSSATVSVEESTITGVFTAPVYMGFAANNPGYEYARYIDNSTTAPASTSINSDESTLIWGTNSPDGVGTDYSTIHVPGATDPPADTTTPVELGTITYAGGQSDLNSIIFGATLKVTLDRILLGFDQTIITTTNNLSNVDNLTSAQANRDADDLITCGNSGNICPNDLQAFENTGGVGGVRFSTPLVVAPYGTFSIDPGLALTGTLPVGGDGGVDTHLAGAVPEPSTWALMLLGFVGLGFAGFRRARKWSVA